MNWKVLDYDVGGLTAYIPRRHDYIGAVIGAVGGLASSVLQNEVNEERDYQQFQYQQQLMREMNHYNSAPEQRKRLEQAGINAALAFSQGHTGAVGSTPSVPQHTPADFSALGAGFRDAGALLLQSRQVEAQNRNLDADTEIKNQQAMTQYSRDMAEIQKILAEENLSKSRRYLLEEQLYQLKDMYDLTKAKNYSELQNVISQTALNEQMRIAKAVEIDLSQKRFMLDKRLSEAQISAISQQIAESVARIRQTDESLAQNAKAIANDVIHNMNQDASAFENIGLSKELIGSEKFRNYVGSATSAIIGAVGTAAAVKWRFGVPPHIRGFRP